MPPTNHWQGKKKGKGDKPQPRKGYSNRKKKGKERGGGNSDSLLMMMASLLVMSSTPEIQ